MKLQNVLVGSTAKLAADEKLAADPRARLNFFYQRSRYWDPELGLYPVWRLPQAFNRDSTTHKAR